MRTSAFVLALLALSGAPIGPEAAQRSTQPNLQDPKPENAISAILDAFATHRVVALGDYHGTKDINDFLLSLVRHPAFPGVANDIVVENIDVRFQSTLDRFVAGEEVPSVEVRRVWREEWNPAAGVNELHAQLIQVVRRINQSLPASRRLRVLAGEPSSNAGEPGAMVDRDGHVAAIVEREVLAKKRKALMFYGAGHLRRGAAAAAVTTLEQSYPGSTYIIAPYVGATARPAGSCGLPAIVNGMDIDAKMSSWPVPSIAETKDTWLAEFARQQTAPPAGLPPDVVRPMVVSGGHPFDAYLYLGQPKLLLADPPSVFTFADIDYLATARARIPGDRIDPRLDPATVRNLDTEVLRCR